MKGKPTLILAAILVGGVVTSFIVANPSDDSNVPDKEIVTVYEVPLVCGAASHIGCGSRSKPLLLDLEEQDQIKEAWLNRAGTAIAVVWNGAVPDADRDEITTRLFEKHKVAATRALAEELLADFRSEGKWYRGADVDALSREEAVVIVQTIIDFVKEPGELSETEEQAMRLDLEEFYKNDLVKLRSAPKLESQEVQQMWFDAVYEVHVRHLGKVRADALVPMIAACFGGEPAGKSCCKKSGTKSCCKKSAAF